MVSTCTIAKVTCTTHNTQHWQELRGNQHGSVHHRHRFCNLWKYRQLGQLFATQAAASRHPNMWKLRNSHDSWIKVWYMYFWWFDLSMWRLQDNQVAESWEFFQRKQVVPTEVDRLIYWWVWDHLVLNPAAEAHVGRDTAINVCQWLREVRTTKLLSMPIQLHVGGLGKVVQIDKILFKHKPKVRQYTREQQVIIKCYHIN